MSKDIIYINLWELQTKPEKVLMAKMDIEANVPEQEKKSLNDFITMLGLTSVYSNNGVMIPYSYIEGNTSNYVFYVEMENSFDSDDEKKLKQEAFESFKSKLESIGYDFKKLTKKSNIELFDLDDENLDPGEYFLINNHFYK